MHNQHFLARMSIVSFFTMGATVTVCTLIYVIVQMVSGPPHYMVSTALLKPLAIPITLSIASNQVIHSVRDLMDSFGSAEHDLGLDELSRALTKTVAPFAAVVLAMVLAFAVNNEYPLWGILVGLSPLTAPFVTPLIPRWRRSD